MHISNYKERAKESLLNVETQDEAFEIFEMVYICKASVNTCTRRVIIRPV